MIPAALRGHNDFLSFYTGASLLHGEMYSAQANTRFQTEHVGFTRAGLLYIRPPFFAFFLRPLTWLPYRTAYLLFQALSVAALFWFIWRFARDLPALPVLCAFSIPVACNLVQGQDVVMVTAIAAAAILLRRSGRPFLGGLLFSVCAVKFHLFLLVPVALLCRREWRMLWGGFAGGVVLAGISFLVDPHWLAQYGAALSDPRIHASIDAHITVRALVVALTGQEGVPLIVGCLLVAAAAIWAIGRTDNLETSIAIALFADVILGYHIFVYDASILFLVAVLVARHPAREIVTLSLLPPVYLLGLLPGVFHAVLPAVLLAIFGSVLVSENQPGIGLAPRSVSPTPVSG